MPWRSPSRELIAARYLPTGRRGPPAGRHHPLRRSGLRPATGACRPDSCQLPGATVYSRSRPTAVACGRQLSGKPKIIAATGGAGDRGTLTHLGLHARAAVGAGARTGSAPRRLTTTQPIAVLSDRRPGLRGPVAWGPSGSGQSGVIATENPYTTRLMDRRQALAARGYQPGRPSTAASTRWLRSWADDLKDGSASVSRCFPAKTQRR